MNYKQNKSGCFGKILSITTGLTAFILSFQENCSKVQTPVYIACLPYTIPEPRADGILHSLSAFLFGKVQKIQEAFFRNPDPKGNLCLKAGIL